MAVKAPEYLKPPLWELADVTALQLLATGECPPDLQKRALDWIIQAAGTYDISFHPDGDRATAFAEGKRFVGLQIVKLLALDRSKFRKE
jgi:hypothetical protein